MRDYTKELIKELNGMMNIGYSVEELPNDDRVWIEIILEMIAGIQSEYQAIDDEDYDNMNTIEKLRADIATEIVEEIKEQLKCQVVDIVYSIEDGMEDD